MTHIDNIRALGNRIVTNLNTMGVSASFSDGALTLADKILDIQTADYSNILLLYADAKIISKDETLELYALYLQDGLPVSNETITFTVKDKNDTIVETLTGTTNADGIANVSYLGKGTGDLNIQASTTNSIILSEIYEIEDCYKYGFKNIIFSQFSSTSNPVVITNQTDNELSFTCGGRASKTPSIFNSTGDWEFSYTVLASKVTNGGLGFGLQSDNSTSIDNLIMRLESREYYGRTVTNLFIGNSQYNHTDMNTNPQKFDVKFVKNGIALYVYINNILIKTTSNLNWLNDPLRLALSTWGGNSSFYQTITNFKIKSL